MTYLNRRVALQVGDAQRIRFQHAFDFFVAELRKRARMIARLDDDFVRADRAPCGRRCLRRAARIALDVVERPKVRKGSHLPWPVAAAIRAGNAFRCGFRGIADTGPGLGFWRSWMTNNYPTASDRIFA